jgi:hypothetical protein
MAALIITHSLNSWETLTGSFQSVIGVKDAGVGDKASERSCCFYFRDQTPRHGCARCVGAIKGGRGNNARQGGI